jgi:hypothetical protein
MPWARIKPAKLERFFTGLSAERVESVVRYFHLRHSPRKIREINDLSEFSAFPWMGLKRTKTIDRLIYQRAASLLPDVANYFEFQLPMDPARWINCVVSCANSTQRYAQSPRTGNTKAQIIRGLEKLRSLYRSINETFREFPELRYAFDEVSLALLIGETPISSESLEHQPLVSLLAEIVFRHIDLDLTVEGEEGRYLTFEPRSAKPKLSCAEKTAYICKRFGGPKIISTPGSDYASICSVIYEIATGKADESMQGSIISFFTGERPELYWYETSDDDGLKGDEMDAWAANFEARRAKIAALVASQFRADDELYVHLLRCAVRQIKNAEEMIESAKKRARGRSLGQRAKKG